MEKTVAMTYTHKKYFLKSLWQQIFHRTHLEYIIIESTEIFSLCTVAAAGNPYSRIHFPQS